jgi:hypothetical protein
MPEHESRGDKAVYDHEIEDPRGGGCRRTVADWGVGEELFDRMPSPRRRFARAEAARRDSHPRERRPEPTESLEPGPVESPAPVGPPAEATPPAPAERPPARRTIVIRGQVQPPAAVPARRRRPPRTAVDRVGHRPDRIAAWAVALGVLLILIAFLSS